MKKTNLKDMFKNFVKNVKEYVNYLMKVDFRELFINVLILICILVLATFAYIPVGMVASVIKGLVAIFGIFSNVTLLIYDWIFNVLGLGVSVVAFVFLFNLRFADIENLKDQINDKPKEEDKSKKKDDDIELPKTKKSK